MKLLTKTRKIILALSLSVICIVAFAGCSSTEDETAFESVDKVAGIEYYHYDTDDFDKSIEELNELATTDKADEIIELYDKLYDECLTLDTLYNVAYLKYSADMDDEYYNDEQLYAYETYKDCCDALTVSCSKIANGPSASEFKEHVGEYAFEVFEAYEPLSGREKEISNQEQKLIDEYYDVLDEVESDDNTYKYKGETWTYDMISGDDGDLLSMSNYDDYLKIYEHFEQQANEKAGEIFIQLVDLRTELAEINGYDNYAEYSDIYEYSRVYTDSELENLYKDVKKVSKSYYTTLDKLYEEGINYYIPSMTTSDMLETLEKYSYEIGKMPSESATNLLDNKLYSIGDSTNRQEGAYTTYIQDADFPFIFLTLEGDGDFEVLTHEFGHFVQYENSKTSNILTDSENIDLAEIASNGYSALMTNYYSDIFGRKGNNAKQAVICELLENVIDGCVMDEFQREIYANPDMTLDEINACYSKIVAEYNENYEGDPGYSWVYTSHNFESPMYYLSYGVSGLAALEIWDESLDDFDSAAKTWSKLVKAGYYNSEYLETVEECGLITFTEDGAVKKICAPALKALKSDLN